jgi:hypothetical protein
MKNPSHSGEDRPQPAPSPVAGPGDSSVAPSRVLNRRDATQAEVDSLPHVADKVPFAAWAVILAGAAERFTYFGIISPWRTPSSIFSCIAFKRGR